VPTSFDGISDEMTGFAGRSLLSRVAVRSVNFMRTINHFTKIMRFKEKVSSEKYKKGNKTSTSTNFFWFSGRLRYENRQKVLPYH
jgi:hypothetical protein